MKQNTYELEVLTPLFMGGSESRLRPELRSPSLRGALRSWYRALAVGTVIVSPGNRDAVNKEETRVFGSTESGSPVSVRLTPLAEPVIETFKKQRAIRTPDGGYLPTGRDYLFWSMASTGRPGTPRFQPDREFIAPGSRYHLTLTSRFGTEALQRAALSLWLLGNLGGLGSRARRGAGSVEIRLKSGESTLPGLPYQGSESISELRDKLSAGLAACLEVMGGSGAQWKHFAPDLPGFNVLAPDTAAITIVSSTRDGWGTYEAALDGIGRRFRDFRSHLTPGGIGENDHDAVLDWFNRNGANPPDIKRAVFGLPIPFRYSDGGASDVILSTLGDRRGSPLHMRVTRLSTGRYVGVLTLFKADFLKEGAELTLQTRKWKAPPPADFHVIEDFIGSFPVKARVGL